MKRLSSFFCFAMTYYMAMAQNNPYDYYYPMGTQIIETEYYGDYIARTRNITYGLVNFNRVLERRAVGAQGFTGYSFRDIDIDYVKDNTLYIDRTRISGNTESSVDGYIIYKLPKANETARWYNSTRSNFGIYSSNYGEATRINIDYKGRSLQALRVIEWEEYDDGVKGWIVFWVRNWGDALRFEQDGTITWINKSLFSDDIKNSAAFKNALARLKAIDEEVKNPKVYTGGKVSFKPATIPSELKKFATEFKTAILERKDLSPYLGGTVLEYYQNKIPYGDNASESFAIFMRDPYFSGLEVLAQKLDEIETSCSIEQFNPMEKTSYYVLPGYSKCIDQYKGGEKIYKGRFIRREDEDAKLGVVIKPLNIYKSDRYDSKVQYTAEPYRLMILSNGRYEGIDYWYQAFTINGEVMGYVLDRDVFVYDHYQFAFSKEGNDYKLTFIPSCNMDATSFEYEQERRQEEKDDFLARHKDDSFDIKEFYREAGSLIEDAIDNSIVESIQKYSLSKGGIIERNYTVSSIIKCYSHDSIEFNNNGTISLVEQPIINVIEDCYDKQIMHPSESVLKKYDYHIPLPGVYEFDDMVRIQHVSVSMSLKKKEWIADKKSIELYNFNRNVCNLLISEFAESNPKLKKGVIEFIRIDTSNGIKYCRVKESIKKEDQEDKYILGSEILF